MSDEELDEVIADMPSWGPLQPETVGAIIARFADHQLPATSQTTMYEQQAAAFMDYHSRKGGELATDFATWCESKRLLLRDRRCIYGIVTEHALSTGEIVATDPAWEPENCAG